MIFIFQKFWHYDLMPTQNIIENYISINKQMINKIKNKISDIDSEKSVAIHFRGQDFKSHFKSILKIVSNSTKVTLKKLFDYLLKILGENINFIYFLMKWDS